MARFRRCARSEPGSTYDYHTMSKWRAAGRVESGLWTEDLAGRFLGEDSRDSVYAGEVTYTYGVKLGRVPEDHAPHQIQKFTASRTEG